VSSLWSRFRGIFSSPADRRLTLAAAQPFGPEPQLPARIPQPTWNLDQPPPPPARHLFDAAYNAHTFRSYSAPLGFDAWDVDRIRMAISLHRQGLFLESSTLMMVCLGFAPVLAALEQAIAPALSLPRHVRGGTRGLSRLVASEIEEQLVPRGALLDSPYFPSTNWATMAILDRMMGFSVLQHVDGEPDPDTGVRPRYTRPWPVWAVQYYRYRRTYVAITTEGPIDIRNDGHFTLVADHDEPHFLGAIAAIGEEVLSGRLTQQSRNAWINKYGQPKWVGLMPEKVATLSPEGIAMGAAILQITGPEGVGVLPHGAEFKTVGLDSKASSSFREALDNVIIHIAMALLGSDGTIRAGGEGAAGPYRSPMFQQVALHLVRRMLSSILRGANEGHIAPYLDYNYAEGRERDRARGIWIDPVLDIPLPDPEADARMDSYARRAKLRVEILASERAAGFPPTQERVDALTAKLELDPVALGDLPIEQWLIEQKIAAPDELRAQRGMAALPDGAGSVKQLAKERLVGKDETGSRGAEVPLAQNERIDNAEATPPNSGDHADKAPSASTP
jgi:hypothetical protein